MNKLGFIAFMYVIIFGIGLITAKHKLKKMSNKKQEDDEKEEDSK